MYFCPPLYFFALKLEDIKLKEKLKILSEFQLYVLRICSKAYDSQGEA